MPGGPSEPGGQKMAFLAPRGPGGPKMPIFDPPAPLVKPDLGGGDQITRPLGRFNPGIKPRSGLLFFLPVFQKFARGGPRTPGRGVQKFDFLAKIGILAKLEIWTTNELFMVSP